MHTELELFPKQKFEICVKQIRINQGVVVRIILYEQPKNSIFDEF